MALEITVLSVPQDAEVHAKRFGAQRDASGRWFVAGVVPDELWNYLPKPLNRHFYEEVPQCPRCGSTMRKRIDQSGDAFWACVTRFRTGCRGTIDYVDYLDGIAPKGVVGDFLPKLAGSLLSPEIPSTPAVEALPLNPTDALRERWAVIVKEAFQILGDGKPALLWLEQPKVAFGGKSPIEMLGTEAGCDAVLLLLGEVWR